VGREELPTAGLEQRHHVLEVGRRGEGGADDRGVERTARRGQQAEQDEPRADLEPPRFDVSMRDAVAEGVGQCSRQCGAAARAARGADRGPGRDVEGDDQRARFQT
jgi:hypothetical protein